MPPLATRPAPGGIDIRAQVSKAATTTRAGLNGRGTGRTPTPPPAPRIIPAPDLPRSAPSLPSTPMPDLAATGDRLKSILAEIEEAAARARAYRPPGSRS
jgi:branched-chain amino acid transport system ATP-binding protein